MAVVGAGWSTGPCATVVRGVVVVGVVDVDNFNVGVVDVDENANENELVTKLVMEVVVEEA